LIICDRGNELFALFDQVNNVLLVLGAIDPSAYISTEGWDKMLSDCQLNMFDLRDNRYNQVVHMVTAADGAPNYYTLKNNAARFEGLQEALDIDKRTRNVRFLIRMFYQPISPGMVGPSILRHCG
jgi:hypothetical protein